jgi:hypothetical protein
MKLALRVHVSLDNPRQSATMKLNDLNHFEFGVRHANWSQIAEKYGGPLALS